MNIPKGKAIFSLLVISAASAFFVKSSLALTPPLDISKLNTSKLNLNVWAVRCSSIKSLAEKKLDKFEENKNKHYTIYVQLSDRIESKMNEWEGLGYDVDEVKNDLKTLNDKIDNFTADYNKYIDKLNAIRDIDCDNTETDLKNAVTSAKAALKQVKNDVGDIRNYYWTVLRPDIMDLKKQKITSSEED